MINYSTQQYAPYDTTPLYFDKTAKKIHFNDSNLGWQEVEGWNSESTDDRDFKYNEIDDLRKIIQVFREKYPEEFL